MLRKKLRIASICDILHLGDGRKGMCTMENKAMIEIFAENLGFARRARGYSQAFMAERLGIARSTYAGYEAGKRSPDVEMIAKLSKELYVSVDELLYDSLEQMRPVYDKRIAETLSDCDPDELQALSEVIGTIKTLVRKKHKASDTL